MADSITQIQRQNLSSRFRRAPRLQYPTFPPLSHSMEEWLSQSRPANMVSHISVDRPSSSLSESWATLSTSDMHSEDGTRSEQTDIASLIDQSGPDEVASLDGHETDSDAYGNDDEDNESHLSESHEFHVNPFVRYEPSVNDSNLTAKPLHESSMAIEFAEPDLWPELEGMKLKHTIHILNENEVAQIKKGLPHSFANSPLAATVQQTMTKHGLELDEPFRVLYVGQSEFRNIVLDKIGDVLVSNSAGSLSSSSTESSRYHVVPTSFGVGAAPSYAELLPIHVQLIVDECLDATKELRTGKPDSITLKFKNRLPCTSFWNGSSYSVASVSEWAPPHLAVLFVAENDDSAASRTRQLAHTFFRMHDIPTLVISEKPFWQTENIGSIPLDHQSLHMCLESKKGISADSVILGRYPIDLKTFESISPGQLNRHLASLHARAASTAPTPPKEPGSLPSTNRPLYDPEKQPKSKFISVYTDRAHKIAPLLRLMTLAIVFAVIIFLGYSAIRVAVVTGFHFVTRSSNSSLSAATPASALSSSASDTGSLQQISLVLRESGVSEYHPFNLKAVGRPWAETSREISHLLSESNMNDNVFQVQAIGDCHVLIKPPSMKRLPKFKVQISRGDEAIGYELSELFDSVYTVRLNREDAYGLLNVSITTTGKTPSKQTTTVDFGTPWLKVASWRKAAQMVSSHLMRDLSTAQTGLSEIYGRLSTDLQLWVGDAVSRTHELRRDARALGPTSLPLPRGATESVLSRSKELTEIVKRNALQQFSAASAVIQRQTKCFNHDARRVINHAYATLAAPREDAGGFFQYSIGNIRISNYMSKAQKAAQKLLSLRHLALKQDNLNGAKKSYKGGKCRN